MQVFGWMNGIYFVMAPNGAFHIEGPKIVSDNDGHSGQKAYQRSRLQCR